MEKQFRVPTTQRAYTLRLNGADPKNRLWRENLWRTHEAVNKGAQAFGDWLLTLRGGLCHTLVDMKVPGKGKKTEREPTEEEKRDRRIILALSWLSVESEKGAPSGHFVPYDFDSKSGKRSNWKTVDALQELLKSRGVSEDDINTWVGDCSASLSAAIREDAVWVNRSKAFDEAVKKVGDSFTRDEVWDLLGRFFNDKSIEKAKAVYLAPISEDTEESGDSGEKEDEAKDLVQKSGQWLSSRFGTGKGADFEQMSKVYEKIAISANTLQYGNDGPKTIADIATALSVFNPASNDLNGVLKLISGPGYKSATRNLLNNISGQRSVTQDDINNLKAKAEEDAQKCAKKSGVKGLRAYASTVLKDVEAACGFTYLRDKGPARHSEYAVMLDHAARRVSAAHTWIKRAEAERRRFEEDAKKMTNVPKPAKMWLDRFCEERSKTSGALVEYLIRKRAVDGWKDLVNAWSRKDCKTMEDRIAAARALQDVPEIVKFGDIQLFEALAADDALCVWQVDGKSDPRSLLDYVAAREAEAKKLRFKVPAYRHPDPLLHPVFCDFGNSRWSIKFDIHESRKTHIKKSRKKAAEAFIAHGLKMGLWDGTDITTNTPLRWSSKRLSADLALDQPAPFKKEQAAVTRADRLGRAATGAIKASSLSIIGLFEQNDWNARLQAPRAQLERIAKRIEKHGWDDKSKSMLSHIKWLITFSAKLQPQGPWVDFIESCKNKGPFERIYKSGNRRGETYISWTGWPHDIENAVRSGQARLILSRLPGLRLLSVDLGHRYGAACVVWETQNMKQVVDACNAAGCNAPGQEDICLHLKNNGKTSVYRRVGPDEIEEVNEKTGEIRKVQHPAPWARLDRQFLIKLQGEEEDARKAGPEEVEMVLGLEKVLGREAPERRSWKVDELMHEAVRTVRLGLKRHGLRARIAFNLTTDKKLKPGGQEEKLTDEGRVELLTDTLADWHELNSGEKWTDDRAKALWDEHIRLLLDDESLPEPLEEGGTSQSRKKRRDEMYKKLAPVAERLAKNSSLRTKLHVLWATRWHEDDKKWLGQLRHLRDWILPRGKGRMDGSIRHVGGLSLTRIATMKSLYQVQKAFRMRPEPADPKKNIPEKGDDTLKDFGRSILDTMERMREQRVKQLASRIAEAALGVGRIRIPKKRKAPKRPRERVDAPCHAVVIENLTRYRPEETRTRRENRQLMTWSSAKVKKYLAEACQLNGLHLREVSAAYTSRQDSRTGAPGVRCLDVPVVKLVTSVFWQKEIKRAREKAEKDKEGVRDRLLVDLYDYWKDKSEDEQRKAQPLRIPHRGGDIFVSADKDSPVAGGIQADLNAAANIGLRAILDPDWPGRWWYVPCDSREHKPVRDKVKGSAIMDCDIALKSAGSDGAPVDSDKKNKKRKGKAKTKDIVNLWRDVSASCLNNGEWQEYSAYWNRTLYKAVRILRERADLGSDDVPF